MIDEGRYTSEQLSAIDSPLSGIIQVEIASGDRASLQAAVDRLVRLIQADPNKARLDRLITLKFGDIPETASNHKNVYQDVLTLMAWHIC
ncbi:hypothetical protein [Halochromatium roseum]|uniref:hypothetical protein n=1 Tax=Halochromatium roseum TaxID=391920 RepID=UPI001911D56B|nr:hypothetical protein [Halochromatium roseum]